MEARLKEEVRDGPLVVDLVADVGRQDDRNGGIGGVRSRAKREQGCHEEEGSLLEMEDAVQDCFDAAEGG